MGEQGIQIPIDTWMKICDSLGIGYFEIDKVVDAITELRQLLWLRHRCGVEALYGDDGEMQCGHCLIDFKRWPVSSIGDKFQQIGLEALAAKQGES